MSRRSERFNRGMASLESILENMVDPSKAKILSDRGKGAADIRMAPDPEPAGCSREQELAGAVIRLVVAERDYLVPTLLLIAENGNDRDKSIEKMNRRTYFRHRDALLNYFNVTPGV